MSPHFGAALDRLVRLRGVRGACVADAADGITLAAVVRDGESDAALAALGGELAARLDRAAQAAGVGNARLATLRGDHGLLVAAPAAGALVFLVLADATANLGLVRLALLDAAAETHR